MKKREFDSPKLFKILMKTKDGKRVKWEVGARISSTGKRDVKAKAHFIASKELFDELGFKDVKMEPQKSRKPKDDGEKGNGNKMEQPSRIARVESRIEKVEKRLLGVESRIEKVEKRLLGVEERLVRVEDKLDKFIDSMNKFVEAQTKFNNEQVKFNAKVGQFMDDQFKFNTSFERRLNAIEKDLSLIKSLPTIKKEIAEQ